MACSPSPLLINQRDSPDASPNCLVSPPHLTKKVPVFLYPVWKAFPFVTISKQRLLKDLDHSASALTRWACTCTFNATFSFFRTYSAVRRLSGFHRFFFASILSFSLCLRSYSRWFPFLCYIIVCQAACFIHARCQTRAAGICSVWLQWYWDNDLVKLNCKCLCGRLKSDLSYQPVNVRKVFKDTILCVTLCLWIGLLRVTKVRTS